MTKKELGDKIRAIRSTRWGCSPRSILRAAKFILWDVWHGGF